MTCRVCGKEKPCAAYIRVSTRDQAKKGYSLPEQRDQAARKAAELGYCPRCIVVYEDIHTGSEMERPAFDRLKEAIRSGAHDVVICLCPDRLGRNTVGMLLAYEELRSYNVRVEYVQINVDDNTPEGNLFLQISAVFSDYERRKIISRIRAGKERKAREAKRLPHHVRLYGYRFDKDSDLLAVDPDEADVVRQMFEWAARGDGDGVPLNVGEICRRLEAMRIPRSDGGTRWYRSTVIRMLRREVYYTGELYTHRWADRPRTVPRPPDRQYTVPVPPIVDEATWKLANANLAARRHVRRKGPVPYALRGIVRCGVCGRRMYTKSSWPRGRLFRYYHCPNRLSEPGVGGSPECHQPCPQLWWNADVLEEAVWHGLRPLLLFAACGEAVAEMLAVRRDTVSPLAARRRKLERQLRETDEKLMRAARLGVNGLLSDQELADLMEPLRQRKAQLISELQRIEGRSPANIEGNGTGKMAGTMEAAPAAPAPEGNGINAALDRFRKIIESGSAGIKRRVLATFVEAVTCFPDGRIHVDGYVPPGEATVTVDEHGRFVTESPIEKRAIEKLQALMGDRPKAGGMV